MIHTHILTTCLHDAIQTITRCLKNQCVVNYVLIGNPFTLQKECIEMLFPEEKVKADKIKNSVQRHYFVLRRSLFKKLLLSILSLNMKQLQENFHYSTKPQLLKGPQLSHSNKMQCLVYSFSPSIEIGIDVEPIEEVIEYTQIVDLFFSAEEQEEIKMAKPKERHELFFKIWTKKEAFYKCYQKLASTTKEPHIYSWKNGVLQFSLASKSPLAQMTSLIHNIGS